MPRVPAILTPLTPQAMRDALRAGHVSWFGYQPTYERLAVGWAQCQLETGRGGAVWNNNVANLKCFQQCQRDHSYARIPVTDPSAEFAAQAAYPSAVEGAASYWRLIDLQYGQALPYYDEGDPYSAMFALYNNGEYPSFFTAPPEGYARSVSALFTDFVARWPAHQYDPAKPYGAESWGERHGHWIIIGGALAAVGVMVYAYTAPVPAHAR